MLLFLWLASYMIELFASEGMIYTNRWVGTSLQQGFF